MKCDTCGRDNLSAKELAIHRKHFHQQTIGAEQPQKISSGACPECGGTLFYQEGCVKCACGYSKCG